MSTSTETREHARGGSRAPASSRSSCVSKKFHSYKSFVQIPPVGYPHTPDQLWKTATNLTPLSPVVYKLRVVRTPVLVEAGRGRVRLSAAVDRAYEALLAEVRVRRRAPTRPLAVLDGLSADELGVAHALVLVEAARGAVVLAARILDDCASPNSSIASSKAPVEGLRSATRTATAH